MLNVNEALEARRSIRYFQDKQVPEETLKAIVKDAQWAPSWANAQPWKVYIATGNTAKTLRDTHLRYATSGAPVEFDLDGGYAEWGRKANGNMGHWGGSLQSFLGRDIRQFPMSQVELFKAPAIAYLTMHKNSPLWTVYDMGAFGQSLMLAAKGRGVDSIAASEYVKYPEYIRKIMGIPNDEAIVMAIGLGYGDESRINKFRSDREPLEDVLKIK